MKEEDESALTRVEDDEEARRHAVIVHASAMEMSPVRFGLVRVVVLSCVLSMLWLCVLCVKRER